MDIGKQEILEFGTGTGVPGIPGMLGILAMTEKE